MANSSALDDVLAAIADPTRRAVVQRLCSGTASVTELAEPFDMALPSFLKHVRVLERCGVIQTQKRGRVRTCSLRPEQIELVGGWLEEQRRAWEAMTDRLESFVTKNREDRP